MGEHILPGNPPVAVTLRRSARAKRISLRVSRVDGKVTLTLPRGVSEREALDFAAQKGPWLRQNLSRHPEFVTVAPGAVLPVEGRLREIVQGQGRRVVCDPVALHVPGPGERAGARVQGWLKSLARERLAAACDGYSAALGLRYTTLTLRDTRSRWGSCTARGGLMFSWRLIMAPPEVLDYVAAHEVAHLREMNHSRAFWDLVEALYGPHRERRRWLRDNGAELHRYRFEPTH